MQPAKIIMQLIKFAKALGVTNIDYADHIISGDQDDILIREEKLQIHSVQN